MVFIFSVVIVSVIVINSITISTKAEYTDNVKIDTEKDSKYSLIQETTNYSVYFANSNDNFFILINFKFSTSEKTIFLKSGILTLNLTKSINATYLRSIHANNTLEFSIQRQLIENNRMRIVVNTIEISLILTPFLPPSEPTPSTSISPIPEEEKKEEKKSTALFSGWGYVTIIIILLFSFVMYDGIRRGTNKIIIKAYKQTNIEENPLDQDRKLKGLSVIGEYKPKYSKFNDELSCYEFRMRHRTKNFKILSNQPMEEYMNAHYSERNYLIRYSLHSAVFEKRLPKEEQYYDDLGWTLQAYLYRFVSFFFNLSITGLIGILIMGFVFIFCFPAISYAFLIGCLVGLIINSSNYILRKYTKICDSLIKRKQVLVQLETFMSPLVAQEQILDVYHVWGTRETEVKTTDGSIKIETKSLYEVEELKDPETEKVEKEIKERKHKKHLDFLRNKGTEKETEIKEKDNKKKDKKAKKEPRQTKEDVEKRKEKLKKEKEVKEKIVDYLTVIGYDAMYRLERDPTVMITKVEIVGKTVKKRTNAEMLSSRRDYIDINRGFVEDIFRLKKTNKEYQELLRQKEIQIQTILENKIKETQKFGASMMKQKEFQETTMQKIFKTIVGEQFVDNDYKNWVKEAYKTIEMERNLTLLNELKILINSIKELLYSSAEKSGLHKTDIDTLIEKLKLNGEKQVAESQTQ